MPRGQRYSAGVKTGVAKKHPKRSKRSLPAKGARSVAASAPASRSGSTSLVGSLLHEEDLLAPLEAWDIDG